MKTLFLGGPLTLAVPAFRSTRVTHSACRMGRKEAIR